MTVNILKSDESVTLISSYAHTYRYASTHVCTCTKEYIQKCVRSTGIWRDAFKDTYRPDLFMSHERRHTQTFTDIQTINGHARAYTDVHRHTQTYTDIHECTRTCTDIHRHAYTYAATCKYACLTYMTRIYVYIYICMYICIRTCMHTYTYKYT
jgi:hypothetical protein